MPKSLGHLVSLVTWDLQIASWTTPELCERPKMRLTGIPIGASAIVNVFKNERRMERAMNNSPGNSVSIFAKILPGVARSRRVLNNS